MREEGGLGLGGGASRIPRGKVEPLDLWSTNSGSRQHHGLQKQEEEPPHCCASPQHRQSRAEQGG